MTESDRENLIRRVRDIDRRAAAGAAWSEDATRRACYQDEIDRYDRRHRPTPRRTKWVVWRSLGAWLTRLGLEGGASPAAVGLAVTLLGKGLVLANPADCKLAIVRLVNLVDGVRP